MNEDLELQRPAIGVQAAERIIQPRHLPAQPPREIIPHEGAIGRRHEVRHRQLADDVRRGVAEDFRQAGVHIDEAVVLDEIDADERLLHERAELRLTRPAQAFRPLQTAEVMPH